MLHVTHYTWHMTHDTWHVTCDTRCGVNILSKFQFPSSNSLWLMKCWRFGGKGSANEWMNEWISDKGVCRTAPATPPFKYCTLNLMKLFFNQVQIPFCSTFPDRQIQTDTDRQKSWTFWLIDTVLARSEERLSWKLSMSLTKYSKVRVKKSRRRKKMFFSYPGLYFFSLGDIRHKPNEIYYW